MKKIKVKNETNRDVPFHVSALRSVIINKRSEVEFEVSDEEYSLITLQKNNLLHDLLDQKKAGKKAEEKAEAKEAEESSATVVEEVKPAGKRRGRKPKGE